MKDFDFEFKKAFRLNGSLIFITLKTAKLCKKYKIFWPFFGLKKYFFPCDLQNSQIFQILFSIFILFKGLKTKLKAKQPKKF